MSEKRYNFIDLFAGCGGLTEGFYKENFHSLAHVEIDHNCCETLKKRMLHYGYDLEFTNNSVIETDITRDDINDVIENVVGKNKVDCYYWWTTLPGIFNCWKSTVSRLNE